MPLYPDLNQQLDIALHLMGEEIDYLSQSDCPYSVGTKSSMTKMATIVAAVTIEPTDKWAKLERETQDLYDDLKDSKENLSIEDHAERMSYFRTATSLLDKLVGLQERAVGLKAIGNFHQTVLDIMEDVLDPGQRTEVMARLKISIEGQK